MTFTINEAFIPRLEHKLQSFQKKFAKYGNGTIVYEIGESFYDDRLHEMLCDVKVEGTYRINDYEFVAVLENDDFGVNLIKKVSDNDGTDIPEIYRTRCECDHCHANRVRKKTVLLRNRATGEYAQIGTACVKDYLGVDIADYAAFLEMWTKLSVFEDPEMRESLPNETRSIAFSVDSILEQSVAWVEKHGYMSRSAVAENGGIPTSTIILDMMLECRNHYGQLLYEKAEVTDEIRDKVAAIKVAILESEKPLSDYVWNLTVIIMNGYVKLRDLGILVSAVAYYKRKEGEAKKREAQPASEWIGKKDDKIEFTSTPECVTSYETEYGYTYVYKFLVNGNDVVWKTGKELPAEPMTIRATVKATDEYRGRKQTIITRGRVL